jgi:Leucine-rich repeat (LRR) protein
MKYTPWVYQIVNKRIKEARVYKKPWLILERLGLDMIPNEVFNLNHLDELIIIDNLVEEISPKIVQLENLTRICFFYNEIKYLPSEIGALQNLTHLDLSCNRIESLPVEILRLDKLEYLDLRFNNLPITNDVLENVYNPKEILKNYFKQLKPVE